MSSAQKQKRPLAVTVFAIWLLAGSIPMLIHAVLNLGNIYALNPNSPNFDNELNQKLGFLMWISLPLGGSLIYANPSIVLAFAAYHYATVFFVLRGSYRSYEMIFGALAIGFVSAFFAPFFFITGTLSDLC